MKLKIATLIGAALVSVVISEGVYWLCHLLFGLTGLIPAFIIPLPVGFAAGIAAARIERKIRNGRHRREAEAHRAGAGGGAVGGPVGPRALLAGAGQGAHPRMSSAVGEFQGLAFAVGQVTGARSWNVDALGRLIGPSFAQVWVPGENVSKCWRPAQVEAGRSGAVIMFGATGPIARSATPREEYAVNRTHSLDTCGCGFYGYYEGSNDYGASNRISGIVQGYGETIIGTRGFKVAKARIVALCPPRTPNIASGITGQVALDPRLLAKVRRNYASVPWFDTFAEMIKAFPPDPGEHEITPETDPDFWTRGL